MVESSFPDPPGITSCGQDQQGHQQHHTAWHYPHSQCLTPLLPSRYSPFSSPPEENFKKNLRLLLWQSPPPAPNSCNVDFPGRSNNSPLLMGSQKLHKPSRSLPSRSCLSIRLKGVEGGDDRVRGGGEENSGDEWRQCGDAKKGEQSGGVKRKGRGETRHRSAVEARSVRELPGERCAHGGGGRGGRRDQRGGTSPLSTPSFPRPFQNLLPHLLILVRV